MVQGPPEEEQGPVEKNRSFKERVLGLAGVTELTHDQHITKLKIIRAQHLSKIKELEAELAEEAKQSKET